MSVSLFEFSFEDISAEETEKTLEQLQRYFKKAGNPHRVKKNSSFRLNAYGQMDNDRIPPSVVPMLPHLQEEGYIDYDGEYVSLREAYRDYPDMGEVDQWFKAKCYEALDDGACYYDLLSLRTAFSIHTNIPSDAPLTMEELLRQRLDIIAMELGLEHFLANPKAAGAKMNIFKDYDKKTQKTVIQDLLMFSTPQEINRYLKEHALCKGIKEYNKASPCIDPAKIPMLDLRQIMPSFFEMVCMAECQAEQTMQELLNYAGAMYSPQLDPTYVLYQGEKRHYDLNEDLKKTFEELDPAE